MSVIFHDVERARVRRSVFDLSYAKKLTFDMGELIPVLCDEALPGDIWQIGYNCVARLTPLITPVMQDMWVKYEVFFVPYRLLMNADTLGDAGTWEDFITGGRLGTSAPALPTWTASTRGEGSLWDYLGFPAGLNPSHKPIAFPLRAYRLIYNEYYMDQNIQAPYDITSDTNAPLPRMWARDYFTGAIPWPQRGTAGSLPITLSGTIDIDGKAEDITLTNESDGAPKTMQTVITSGNVQVGAPSATADARWSNPALEVDISSGTATSVDINALRLQVAIQRLLERNARSGARYEEYLRAHFGVSGGDARFQIPEMVGASSAPLIISEVLQTAATDTGTSSQTAQGNMTGHGISVSGTRIGTYRVREHGLFMGLVSVVPKAVYHEGVERQWGRETRYDFFHPELVGLGEQAIYEKEVYNSGVAGEEDTVFAYQGRYDEYRHKRDTVAGLFNSTLGEWTLLRTFGARPTFDTTFLRCSPQKTIFADSTTDAVMMNFQNIIKAVRPLPKHAIPGGII